MTVLRRAVVFCAAVVLGASVVLISGGGSVALPVVGAQSGQIVGGLGVALSAVVYRQWGCGSASGCGCSESCGESCSYDS